MKLYRVRYLSSGHSVTKMVVSYGVLGVAKRYVDATLIEEVCDVDDVQLRAETPRAEKPSLSITWSPPVSSSGGQV